MLQISQIHGRLAKLGLQMKSSQQRFLNKEKRPRLKIQTPKRVRYLWHYLIRILQSPTGPAEGVGDFSKFKRKQFWPTYAFQWFPWISSLFHTVFNAKSLTFTARSLAHRPACQRATSKECRADFSKFVFYAFQSGKNNKLGSVTKIPRVLNERFKRIFSKMSQTVLQKELFRATELRIRTYREKTAKTLARFLKPEPDKINKMQFNK